MATEYWGPVDGGGGAVVPAPPGVSLQRAQVRRRGAHRSGGQRRTWPFQGSRPAPSDTRLAGNDADPYRPDEALGPVDAYLTAYSQPVDPYASAYPQPVDAYASAYPQPVDVYQGVYAQPAPLVWEPQYQPADHADRVIDLTDTYVDLDAYPPPPIAAATQIDARAISAWFGTHKVLDRVSLHMPAGTVTALIGPSGCGKSTFLRILNRMHELVPSAGLAGEVLLNGEDIYEATRRVTETRKRIGMVFQKPNPFPAMTIGDNVVAGLKLNGTRVSRSERDALIEECLTRGGLWNEVKDRLDTPGGALSGGQQQRLCIARSLAVRPEVLLMDEPCSALDPTSTRRVEETIAALASEVTIVIVTHNMQQANRVSQQCAFFLAEQGTPGFIVESGATQQIFNAPRDPRTADYVNGRFG
jgi:phosphate transport system ATP-binding protein